MEAAVKLVRDILHSPNQFLVPFFQRHYAWTQKQWEQLHDDIMALQSEDPKAQHFLGPLVCTPETHMPAAVTPYQLIDGQQRLATLMVILAAIRDLARARGINNLADLIVEDYLIHRHEKGLPRYKVMPRLGDREPFFALIDAKSVQDFGRFEIIKAWQYFHDKFGGYILNDPENKLTGLFHAVTGRLSLVVITIDGENPYEIFESLNTKGLQLEESDLIRNFIFMQVQPREKQEEFSASHWQPFEASFGAVGKFPQLDQTPFYRSYLMRNGFYSKDRATFIDFKRQNKERNVAPTDQVAELKHFAQFEIWLRRPETCPDPELAKALGQIQMLDITTAHPLIFHLLDLRQSNRLSLEDLLSCLQDLSSFVLRRTVCGESTRPYARWFPEATKMLEDNPHQNLRNYWLRRGWPEDELFASRLAEFALYRREANKSRLILESLEESYGHREKVQFQNLEIEHVMPQSIGSGKNGADWKKMLGDDWEEIHDTWLHTLGNLTLTGYNQPLGNKTFKDKKTQLAKSNLELNGYFAQTTVWAQKEIKKRGRDLARRVVKLWPRPAEGPAYVPTAQPDSDTLDAKARAALRLEYWTALLNLLVSRATLPDTPEPTTKGYLCFDPGWEGVSLWAYTDNWEGVIGVYLRFNKERAGKLFSHIAKEQPQIEARFGTPLQWYSDDQENHCYITLRLPGLDPLNKAQWPDQHKWLAKKLEEYIAVFDPLIEKAIQGTDLDPRSGTLTKTETIYLDYWETFTAYVKQTATPLRFRKPATNSYLSCASPLPGYRTGAELSARDATIEAYVGTYDEDLAKQLRRVGAEHKSDLEKALGAEIEISHSLRNGDVWIYAWKEADPAERKDWPLQHKWLKDTAERLPVAVAALLNLAQQAATPNA